jgi:hypothetical protein
VASTARRDTGRRQIGVDLVAGDEAGVASSIFTGKAMAAV